MRVAQERAGRPGLPKSSSMSLPAPIGGLNARDSIANMKPNDAIVLDNWFPTPTSVDLRYGYDTFATFTGPCETVMVYAGLTATKVFVVVNTANDTIFDATAGGALSTAAVGGSGPAVQALTSARFDYANFGTVGGQFMSCVNGANVPLQFDGTTWIASAMTGGPPADFFTVAVYAERLWFGVKDSLRVRYLPVNAITGATVELNLASLFKLGGSLNSIITVTDATNALTDYIAFLSTEGEIVAFTGTDPAVAASWTRAAHFRIGRPITKGNRCWTKWGADALVVCADGVLPLRQVIAASSRDSALSVSDKIRDLLNADLQVNGARFGWVVTMHPTGAKLIVNVPTNENVEARQYVMNTQTGAWCRFTGWNAFCIEVAKDTLYFGGNGVLAKADHYAYLDDDGEAITADAKQAFGYFGQRGRTKLVTLMRPILSIDGGAYLGVDIDVDYEDTPPTTLQQIVGTSGDPWGGIWDATWGGTESVLRDWYSVSGEGHAIAPRIKAQASGVNLSWSASDFIYEIGGALG